MSSGYLPVLHALAVESQRDHFYHDRQLTIGRQVFNDAGISDPTIDEQIDLLMTRAGVDALSSVLTEVAHGIASRPHASAFRKVWESCHERGKKVAARWKDFVRNLPPSVSEAIEQLPVLGDQYRTPDIFLRLAHISIEVETLIMRFTDRGVANGRAKQTEALALLPLVTQPGVLIVIGTRADGTPVCERYLGALSGTLPLGSARDAA